jgi:hypothetical protein
MGSDVYLEWDGMSEKAKKAQTTGFSIDAGRYGYLRASIGMVEENRLMRELFPNCWTGRNEPYNFSEANYITARILGASYLVCTMCGKEFEPGKSANAKNEAFNDMITMAISKAARNKGAEVEIGDERADIVSAVRWLNSLFGFFELGMEKQEKGLNPTIYISY